MQKSILISTTCLLVCVATNLFNFSPSLAQRSRRPLIAYQCQGFSETIFKIVLKKDKAYSVQSREVNTDPKNPPKTLPGGRYVSFRKGFRFKTGELKDQSILRQDNNIYLVATSDEARAAEVAAADGAAFCKQI